MNEWFNLISRDALYADRKSEAGECPAAACFRIDTSDYPAFLLKYGIHTNMAEVFFDAFVLSEFIRRQDCDIPPEDRKFILKMAGGGFESFNPDADEIERLYHVKASLQGKDLERAYMDSACFVEISGISSTHLLDSGSIDNVIKARFTFVYDRDNAVGEYAEVESNRPAGICLLAENEEDSLKFWHDMTELARGEQESPNPGM